MDEIEKWINQEHILTHNKDLADKLTEISVALKNGSEEVWNLTDEDKINDMSVMLADLSDQVLKTAESIKKRAVITNESKVEEIIRDLSIILDRQIDYAKDINDDLINFIENLNNDLK